MMRVVLLAALLAISVTCLVPPACINVGKTINDPVSPIYVEFSFPQGPPWINMAKELKCVVKTADTTADNVEITIDLPAGLQLISGNLSAKFKAMSKNDVKELLATIKPVKYGDYAIDIKYSCGSKYTYSGLCTIYLAIADRTTEWYIHPILRGAVDGWLLLPEIKLSLTQAPALNQTGDLTCTLLARSYDLADTKVKITSYRRIVSDNGSDIEHPYIAGDSVTQTFILKANQPISFSSKIVFKEAGLWKINAEATAYSTEMDRHTGGDGQIYLTVYSDKGEIGWPLYFDWPLGVPRPATPPPPPPALLPDGTWIPVK